MSNQAAIIEALFTHLQTFTAGGDVVIDGQLYEPQQNRPYLFATLSSYARNPTGFGADCVYQEAGTFQVMVNRPAGEGPLPAAQMADALTTLFRRGQGVALGTGPFVHFENVSAQPAITTGGWRSVPVVVSWYCTDP
jgi:hypothetical protein